MRHLEHRSSSCHLSRVASFSDVSFPLKSGWWEVRQGKAVLFIAQMLSVFWRFYVKKSPISERSMFLGIEVDICCPSVSNYSCGLVTFIKSLKRVSRYYKLLSYSY